MKLLTLSILLISCLFRSQTSESVVKMFCKCDPLTYSEKLDNSRIFYIQNESESFSGVNLTYNMIHKINGQWIKKYKHSITFKTIDEEQNIIQLNDFDFASSEENYKEIKIVYINGIQFFFSIVRLDWGGTASNGSNNYLFYFQSINLNKDPIKIFYERSNQEFSGRYYMEKGNIDDVPEFIEETSKFITDIFGASNDNIDSEENFHLKWRDFNSHIFENLNDNGYSYTTFVKFDTDVFYKKLRNEYDSEEIENNSYKIQSGFISPLVVYDKIEQKSIVVFIPDGWPNGASWGSRSFYPKKIIGNTVIFESEDEILQIDLKNDLGNGYIKIIKK